MNKNNRFVRKFKHKKYLSRDAKLEKELNDFFSATILIEKLLDKNWPSTRNNTDNIQSKY